MIRSRHAETTPEPKATPQVSRDTPPQEGHEDFFQYSAKVSRQASVFLLGTLSSLTLGYLFKAYLGRVLGAEALGIYTLGLQTVGLVVLLAGLGYPYVLARFVAIYRGRRQWTRIRKLLAQTWQRTWLASACLASLLWLGRRPLAEGLFGAPDLALYLPLFALLIPLSTSNSLLGQYLRGHQEVTRRTVIHHFVQLPIKIAVTLLLLQLGFGLAGYITAELVSQLVAVGLLWLFSSRLTPSVAPSAPVPSALDAENRAYGRQLLALEILRFLSARIDIFLLGALATTAEVGIYAMAVTSAAFIPTLLRALNSIFGPMISDLHSRGQMDLLRRLFKATTRWCVALTCPLVVIIIVFSPALMGLFGEAFVVGRYALVWLALGQLVNVGTGAVGNLLVMSGHQRLEIWASLLTALATLGLGILWIPQWGMTGAGAAAGMGLALANVVRLALVRRFLDLKAYDLSSLRLLPPLTAAAVTTLGVSSLWGSASLLGLLLAPLASYAVLGLTAWPFLSSQDRALLDRMLSRLPCPKGQSRAG